MLDIHSHIAYGIDDGAENESESFEMLSTAFENGTDSMVLTPHFPNRIFGLERTPLEYVGAVESFISLAKKKFPDMNFYTGAEFFCGKNGAEFIEHRQLIPIGNTSHVLVEFPFESDAGFILDSAKKMLSQGYEPIIAHIERYSCFMHSAEKIRDLRNMGCVIQVNGDGLITSEPVRTDAFARWILEKELADVVASDCHDAFYRTSDLSAVHENISLRFSVDYADMLLDINPKRIIEDRTVIRRKN